MSSISAGLTSGTALVSSGDTTGELLLKTNGTTTAVTIDTSQRVGIGTSSPTAPLDVVSNSSAVGISLRGRSADNIGTLCFYTNNGVTNDAQVQMRPSDNEFRILVSGSRFQSFYTNGSERMRITAGGSIGIGTVTPATKLEVSDGAITAGASAVVLTGRNSSSYPTTGAGYFQLQTNNNDSVNGGISIYTNASGLRLSYTIFETGSGSYHAWNTSGSERMRLDASGNLLVGKTSSALNNITGTAISGGFITTHSNSGNGTIELGATRAAVAADIGGLVTFRAVYRNSDSDSTTIANIKGFRENATNNNWSSYLSFETTNGSTLAERARITSGGNFGVGISNPGQRLSVLGTANASYNAASGINVDYQSSSTSVTVPIGFSWSSSIGGQGSYWGMGMIPVSFGAGSADLGFYTQASEKMRITAGGLILLGASSSQGNGSRLQVSGSMQMFGSQGANGLLNTISSYNTNSSGFEVAKMEFYTGANIYEGQILFSTKDSGGTMAERARIDSGGNFYVGTTTSYGRATIEAGANLNGLFVINDTYDYQTLSLWNKAGANDNLFARFFTESSLTLRGSITYNRGAGLTAYNTTSDYRAKDISGSVTDSGALIDSVPVYMGKMKGATQERPMFIAHEVPAYARTGEKDAVDADGNPVYQQMDASALIPVMWAEIQSLRQRLAAAGF